MPLNCFKVAHNVKTPLESRVLAESVVILAGGPNRARRLSPLIPSNVNHLPVPAFGYTNGRAYLCGLCLARDSKTRWLALKKRTPPVQCRYTEPSRMKGYRVSPQVVATGREKGGRYGENKYRGENARNF